MVGIFLLLPLLLLPGPLTTNAAFQPARKLPIYDDAGSGLALAVLHKQRVTSIFVSMGDEPAWPRRASLSFLVFIAQLSLALHLQTAENWPADPWVEGRIMPHRARVHKFSKLQRCCQVRGVAAAVPSLNGIKIE